MCGSLGKLVVIDAAIPLSTRGVEGVLDCPAMMFTETDPVERRFPTGFAGELLLCSVSYVATANVSFPRTAGALAIHSSAPRTSAHDGLLSVRLVAIEEGMPVKAVPLT